MTKSSFMLRLRERLSSLSEEEIEERLDFYSEMIEDRIEEGLSEEEAVADTGDVDEIADNILSEVPFVKVVKDKIRSGRKMKVWEVILLVLGAPVWLSLLVALASVILAVYLSVWSCIIALLATEVSIFVSSIAIAVYGAVSIACGSIGMGLATIGISLFGFGLSVFGYYVCKLAVVGIIRLTKALFKCIKRSMQGKEKSK